VELPLVHWLCLQLLLLLCFLVIAHIECFSTYSGGCPRSPSYLWIRLGPCQYLVISLLLILCYDGVVLRWVLDSPIWIEALARDPFWGARIIEAVLGHGHFLILEHTGLLCVSVAVLRVPIIRYAARLLFNWGTSSHVLSAHLNASVGVVLKARLLIESLFEVDPVVRYIRLLNCQPTTWDDNLVVNDAGRSLPVIRRHLGLCLEGFIWICVKILKGLPQIDELIAVTGTRGDNCAPSETASYSWGAYFELELCLHRVCLIFFILISPSMKATHNISVFVFVLFFFLH